MSKNIWEEFDKNVDLEGLQKDLDEFEKNGGQQNFKEVPHGNYEVAVDKMEMKTSKNTKKPMFTVWFKIVEGEYKNSMIFVNQVIDKPYGIHKMHELLRGLTSECDGEYNFTTTNFSYTRCNEQILDAFEEIHGNYEFALEYKANTKNPQFNDFKILEVYELED